MDEQTFLEKMDAILDSPVGGGVKLDFDLTDCDEWDSLAKISFVALAKMRGKFVDQQDVKRAKTLGDLYKLLQ